MTSRREFLKKAGLLTAAFTVPTLNTQGETTQSRLSLKNTKIAVDDRWDVYWKIPNNYFTIMEAINKGVSISEVNRLTKRILNIFNLDFVIFHIPVNNYFNLI